MSEIHCVVVTPEKTEVDVKSTSVTVPLFDGELGILKGHSPLVGRLGFGVLRVHVDGQIRQYFIEEGLVQVNNNVVAILTDRVTPLDQINAATASQATEAALTMPKSMASEAAVRTRALNRARALTRIASRS